MKLRLVLRVPHVDDGDALAYALCVCFVSLLVLALVATAIQVWGLL